MGRSSRTPTRAWGGGGGGAATKSRVLDRRTPCVCACPAAPQCINAAGHLALAPEGHAAGGVLQAQRVCAVELLGRRQAAQLPLEPVQLRVGCCCRGASIDKQCFGRCRHDGGWQAASRAAVQAASGGAPVMGPLWLLTAQPPSATPEPSSSTAPPAALTAPLSKTSGAYFIALQLLCAVGSSPDDAG